MRGQRKGQQAWQVTREQIRRRIREANGKPFYLAPSMRVELDGRCYQVETGPIARRLGAMMTDSLNYWRIEHEPNNE